MLGEEVCGEARDVGKFLACSIRPGEAVIAGGETTVTVKGEGRGGRNQELALGALKYVKPGALVAACASDGIDNATPVAGAVADLLARAAAAAKRLDPDAFLERNDSYNFTKQIGNGILTGKTGSNVSDFMLGLAEK